MADASNAQTSFLSGEWSPYAQGRFEDPEYKRGMNVCRNGHPVEAGAWVRRAGSRHKGYTRKGQKGKVIEFSFSQSAPYDMEFTDGKLRFYDSQGPIMSEEPRRVIGVSDSAPARISTVGACSEIKAWADGDQVVFNFLADGAPAAAGILLGRQFSVIMDGDDEHFFLYDGLTQQPIDGASINFSDATPIVVSRIYELDTPYDQGSWAQVRAIQDGDSVLLLHPNVRPYQVFAPIDGGNLFTLNATQNADGPYLDPPVDGSFLTVSGTTGDIDCEIVYPTWSSGITYKNGTRFFTSFQARSGAQSTTFQFLRNTVVIQGGIYYVSLQDNNTGHNPTSSPLFWRVLTPGADFGPPGLTDDDVGRVIRLLAQPDEWDVANPYVVNDLVTYQNATYVALQTSTGKVPGNDPDNWGVASNAAKWTWGIITDVSSATAFSMTIMGDDLLYDQNVTTFRFGAWSDSTRWPATGTFHEGRFWLGGAIKNRFDASALFGNTMEFTPTAPDGTVSDANGISYTLLSPQQNLILWMLPDRQGIIMGTAQGEWLVQSSANNDPITPTSIQAHNFTKIGSADVEAIRTGMTLAFVQRFGKKVIDYVGDPFGNFAGLNLNERAKHLTNAGIARIAYQHELTPIIWALTNDNQLIGTTYKRDSVMPGQLPTFNGWHRHDLGSGHDILDMCASASPNGLVDSVTLITQDPNTGFCSVETLTEMFDESNSINNAWFVDDGTVPSSAQIVNQGGQDGVLLTGYGRLEGETLSVFLGGQDLGDKTVSNGTIFLPFNTTFTLAMVQALDADDWEFSVRILYDNPGAGTMTMMEFPSIGSPYLDGYTYLSYGRSAVADWARDRVTFLLFGTNPYAGLIQYRISTGALIRYAQVGYIFGSEPPPFYDAAVNYAGGSLVVASDNRIYTTKVVPTRNDDPTDSPNVWVVCFTNPGAYNAGTNYTGLHAKVTYSGVIYQNKVNGNTGNQPDISPTFWTPFFATPPNWDANTTYSVATQLTAGASEHIYYGMLAAPAGTGSPSSFDTNNNPYWATEGSIWQVGQVTDHGLGLDFNGDIYMWQGNDHPYVKVSGETLKAIGFMTAAEGKEVPQPSNYVVPLRILTNKFKTEADFILETVNSTPSGSTTPSAVLMEVGSLIASENKTFRFDEGSGPIACRGSAAIGVGQAFVLTRPLNGQANTGSIGLYEINVFSQSPHLQLKPTTSVYKPQDPNKGIYGNYGPKGSAMRKAGTIAPSDIDPSWVSMSSVGGIFYDQRDGNVIFSVTTGIPSAWATGHTFQTDGSTILSFTTYSGNVYRFVTAPTWSSLTTYALNQVVSNGSASATLYKSLANGNLNNALSDPTKWVAFYPEPTVDTTYWELNGPVPANSTYLVKTTTDCAQVVWRTADAEMNSTAINVQFNNIVNGHLVYVRGLGLGAFEICRVNTITGGVTHTAVNGTPTLGAVQIYNEVTGDIILYPQYNAGASGAPTPVDPEGGTTHTTFTGFARLNIVPDQIVYTVPGVAGYTYTSQGQLLRPVSPAESGARNGPAFGKTRRNHRYAAAVANTTGISFGSEFEKLRPALFKSRAGKGALLLTAAVLYTGEHSDTVEGDYDLDGMLCWQITRPYPATLTALGGFLQTQDR